MNQYEQYLYELFGRVQRYVNTRPLNLGGYTTISGGGGGPPGGFTGYLPQTRVTYDSGELETMTVPASGSSLLDNLNRIRYRIAQLESVSGSGNVFGDASVVDGHLAVFDVDGYHIKDGGAIPEFSITNDIAWDAKGDLIVGTGNDVAVVLSVGNDGEVLSADSSTATGLKWVTISGVTTSGSGTGDVVGPNSSVNNNFASFDGTDGKLLKDSGYDSTDFATSGHTHAQLHDAVTVLDSSTIDFSISGQEISGVVVASGIKLDDLGTPDDNADLDASTDRHGLMQKYPGGTTTFLRADGTFAIPTTSGSGTGNVTGPETSIDDNIATFDGATGKLIQDGGAKISDLVGITVLEDMKSPTGFIDRTTSSISFADGSREFTIIPSGVNFSFYSAGTKYTKTTTQTKQITVASGLHYVYFDTNADLQESTTPWDINSENVTVACVYWNGTNGLLMDERHGIQMDGMTHEYLHETRGSAFVSGMAGTFASNGSTITIGSGEWYDDDIEYITSEYTQCKVFYLQGAVWNWTSAQNAYYHTVGSVPQYNNSGSLANVGVAQYSISWVYMTNIVDTPIVIIMGQGSYLTQALAEAAGVPNLGSLPATELVLLYKIIWQRNGATITWKRTDDYRRVSGGPVSNYIATDHGALAGLADNDHTQYILSVADTSTVNLTLSTQEISADVIPGGIKLDDLGTPDNNTDLNVTTTYHGLVPVLPNDSSKYLNGVGEWVTVSGSGGNVATDSIWDAKGDLAVGTGNNTATVLASGSEGQVLTVSSGSGTGLAWSTPSGGAVDIIMIQVFN